MSNERVNLTHITVLKDEAVAGLNVRSDGIYVDGTFGRGGHSRLILSQLGEKGRLIVFDKDPQAIAEAKKLASVDFRVSVVHEGFSSLTESLMRLNIPFIDGALFDLGISSPQIDEAERGFSFRFDAPLDMRMDTTRGQSAAQWLREVDEKTLFEVIRDYGEERFSRLIAQQIVLQRDIEPIATTRQLAQLVGKVVYKKAGAQDPATRTFQAIRIFINRELDELGAVLPQALSKLNERGRLVVIAFHSLEDRIVKQFMRQYSQSKPLPRWVMVKEQDREVPPLRLLVKGSKPSDLEVQNNPRSRSAVLRIAERTQGVIG